MGAKVRKTNKVASQEKKPLSKKEYATWKKAHRAIIETPRADYASRIAKSAKVALKQKDVTERIVRSTHGKNPLAESWGDRWDDATIAKVEKLRGDGMPVAMIAKTVGRSVVAIQSRKWATPLKRDAGTKSKTLDAVENYRQSMAKTLAKSLAK